MRWKIRRPGQVLGPFTDEKLRDLAAEGLVVPNDEIFPDGETGDVVFRASDVVRKFGKPPQAVPRAPVATAGVPPAAGARNESGTFAMVQAIVLPMLFVLVVGLWLVPEMNGADIVVAIGMGWLAATEPVLYVQRRFGRDVKTTVTRMVYWVVFVVLAIAAFLADTSRYDDGLTSDRFVRSLASALTKVLILAAVAYCIGMSTKWGLEIAYSERKK
jgi:hypothetical protein